MALSVGFIRFVSFANATQVTELLTLAPMGLTPIEHASLRWTHCFAKTHRVINLLILPSDARTVIAYVERIFADVSIPRSRLQWSQATWRSKSSFKEARGFPPRV
jgi:hypothetical protein